MFDRFGFFFYVRKKIGRFIASKLKGLINKICRFNRVICSFPGKKDHIAVTDYFFMIAALRWRWATIGFCQLKKMYLAIRGKVFGPVVSYEVLDCCGINFQSAPDGGGKVYFLQYHIPDGGGKSPPSIRFPMVAEGVH